MFNTQHNIFPLWIAIPVALGVLWTYLSGLAYVTYTSHKTWYSSLLIIVGAVTDGLFGILYIMGAYHIIPDAPNREQAFQLALAHIVPLIILLIIYTFVKRDYFVEKATKVATIEAEQREEARKAKARKDELDKLNATWQAEQLKVAVERERIKLEAEKAKLAVKSKIEYRCEKCGMPASQASYAAMKRYGYCKHCKPKDAA